MAARRGAPGTTSRRRSSITSPPTTRFRIASAAGSRRAARSCIQSRGDDGQITFRDWHPVGVEEYGYVAPDPLDPDIVYGGKVSRYDRRTGRCSNVGPRFGRPRGLPRRAHGAGRCSRRSIRASCIFASNMLWQTHERRTELATDQPRPDAQDWEVPPNVGNYRERCREAQPTQRGVIYTIAPSYRRRAARSGPAPTTA